MKTYSEIVSAKPEALNREQRRLRAKLRKAKYEKRVSARINKDTK